MTELLFLILSLLGFDATPAAAYTPISQQQRQASGSTSTATQLRNLNLSQHTRKSLANGGSADTDGRGGGSRQIGGPVIVFDDVMFKPVNN